ncbi:MAG: DsbA family protein [Candidatus Pacebacteria bacterium]|nr:DsbA family protein [Candidatus Paceibacterota bacterium]
MKKPILFGFVSPGVIMVLEGVIILALIGVLVFKFVQTPSEKQILSPQEVADRAINYINENFLRGGVKAELIDVFEEAGVYKIGLKIQEEEYTSYVTKDGKLLFPEAIDLMPPEPKEFPKTEKPDVKLFVMSFCPFGDQAEEMLMPVVDLLKDKANIELHYIFYKNYASGYPEYCLDKENKYCAMHGIGELNQNIRELCVWKYQKDKFWDFVRAINKNATSKNVDEKWEEIAKNLGINVAKIKECQKNEIFSLLDNEIALTSKFYPVQDPKAYGKEESVISASPTLVINGIIYTGNRSSEDYKRAICSAFKNPPKECEVDLSSIPTPSTAGGSCQ